MQIKRDWKSALWHSVAQGLFGGIALALVTLACFRLGLDLATTAFAYLIVIVLLSLMGSFYVSAVLSIIAVVALIYFFASDQSRLGALHGQANGCETRDVTRSSMLNQPRSWVEW